jgi:hypothetical protein
VFYEWIWVKPSCFLNFIRKINLEIRIGIFFNLSFFSSIFSAAKRRDRIGKDKEIGKRISDVSFFVFLEEI